INQHRLGALPLGRFARSLSDLPQGLWHIELSAFTRRELSALITFPGFGSERVRQVLEVVSDIARTLSGAPLGSHLLARLLPAKIHAVACWVDEHLQKKVVPDMASLRHCFVAPLVEQLELDLGEGVAGMIRRRWGVDRKPETLEEVATSVGL